MKYCDTYVAVTDAPDLPAGEAGQVVWRLRTLFEGGLGSGSFDKTSAKVGNFDLVFVQTNVPERYHIPLQTSTPTPRKSSWCPNGVISSHWTTT